MKDKVDNPMRVLGSDVTISVRKQLAASASSMPRRKGWTPIVLEAQRRIDDAKKIPGGYARLLQGHMAELVASVQVSGR